MEKRRFEELGLSAELLKAVDKMGFEEASPIQTAVIPLLLAGRDVVGQSSTGSGKTAAFAIPAIEKVSTKLKAPQVLILCPTRELAVQVAEETAKLAFFKRGTNAVPIYGGQSYERQYRALEAGAQIVIGTPGRVLDHMERGSLRFDGLKMLVLDEADRMLDMGFRDEIERIMSGLPKELQLLFFSATMPRAIQELIAGACNDPAWVKIEAHAQNAPKVQQAYFEVDRRTKLEALTRVIDLHDFRYGIIFCSTKVMVDDLDEHLHARGYAVDRLHGDMSQAQRDRVMDKFRRRGFEFLVATDVAARGLDVDDLEVVFNFDLPNDAEDYIHRIGRTGRAGNEGHAFTFVSGREIYKLQSMVRFARLSIRRESLPSLDQVEEARENVFFERLRGVLQSGEFRQQDRMIDRLLEQGYSSTDIAAALIHLFQQGSVAEAPKPQVPAKAPAWVQAKMSVPRPVPVAAEETTGHLVPPQSPENEEAGADDVATAAAPMPPESAPSAVSQQKTRLEFPSVPMEEPSAQEIPPPALSPDAEHPVKRGKKAYSRPTRTGKEPGMCTLFFNVGSRHFVTPADLVGKISGVTRLPSSVVGAIDIRNRCSLVDVAEEHAPQILSKMQGIRLRGQNLSPIVADKEPSAPAPEGE